MTLVTTSTVATFATLAATTAIATPATAAAMTAPIVIPATAMATIAAPTTALPATPTTTLATTATPTNDDDKFSFNNTDKQLHMLASYAIAYTATDAFRRMKYSKWKSIAYGSLVAIAVGTLKELTDKKFSSNDLLADGIGVGVSAGVNITFDSLGM